MPTIRINEIRGHSRTQINDQARLSGYVISTYKRKPAVEPQPLVVVVSILNPRQLSCRHRTDRVNREGLNKGNHKLLGFLGATDTDQTTGTQLQPWKV
ncbi:hypothetical protein PSCICJ_34880 [Pseudomonas cichorii]|nr:hypothetical protein PSCICJ_34880 [Pseudomonas cichorii]